jgi:hypothetical protein
MGHQLPRRLLVRAAAMARRIQPVDATLLAEALRRGSEAIPPLRTKILDNALVP